MMKHELANLEVKRDSGGIVKGIVATCTCGWTSGPRFSSMIAQVQFMDHKEKHADEKP